MLGIGRIAPPVGEKQSKAKYIQPEEWNRLYELNKFPFDILLTHDASLDSVTKGAGMEEIRLLLDAYQPLYHFYGHTEQPFTQFKDQNGITTVTKMADLHWDQANRVQPLEKGAMGILRWKNRVEHTFEKVEAGWMNEYTAKTWRSIS